MKGKYVEDETREEMRKGNWCRWEVEANLAWQKSEGNRDEEMRWMLCVMVASMKW